MNASPVLAVVKDVKFEPVKLLDDNFADGLSMLGAFEVSVNGRVEPLSNVLCEGELGTNELKPVHSVRREFDPPAVLLMNGNEVALLKALGADVGDFLAPSVSATVAGPEAVAWLLINSLTDARAWIASDGGFWTIGA